MVRRYRHAAVVALTLVAVLAIQVVLLGVVLASAVPALGLPAAAAVSFLGRLLGVGVSIPAAGLAVGVPAFVVLVWAQLRYARREALEEADAHPVGDDHPDLEPRVRRLAMAADLEPPRVAVSESPVPNSFGIGGPRPTVVVSEGLLSRLPEDELDAVLAHELAHVKNHDVTVMTMAAFLPALASDQYSLLKESVPVGLRGGVALLTAFTVGSTAFVLFELGIVGLVYPMVLGAGVMVGYVFGGWVVDQLARLNCAVAQFLSRHREYAADRTAAHLTGDPAALAAALERLDGAAAPTRDARLGGGTVQSLSLLPSVADASNTPGFRDPGGDPWASHRTHPATTDRVERLRAMTADLESA